MLFNWTIAFLTAGRPERAITTQQVFARQVRAKAAAVSSSAAAFHALYGASSGAASAWAIAR